MKYVWNIVEREGMERPFWNRIGVAFENSDGSLNVRLDCLPLNGKLHIRDRKEQERGPEPPG
ncbi:MAG: hypothetical protein U0610_09880 [bacterium]